MPKIVSEELKLKEVLNARISGPMKFGITMLSRMQHMSASALTQLVFDAVLTGDYEVLRDLQFPQLMELWDESVPVRLKRLGKFQLALLSPSERMALKTLLALDCEPDEETWALIARKFPVAI